MRLVDADLLKEQMESVCMGIMAGTESYNAPLKTIDDAPTVDAKPVVRGKWIKNEGRYGWHCSVCEKDDFYAFVRDSDTDENKLQDYYCPNCGAKMDKED